MQSEGWPSIVFYHFQSATLCQSPGLSWLPKAGEKYTTLAGITGRIAATRLNDPHFRPAALELSPHRANLHRPSIDTSVRKPVATDEQKFQFPFSSPSINAKMVSRLDHPLTVAHLCICVCVCVSSNYASDSRKPERRHKSRVFSMITRRRTEKQYACRYRPFVLPARTKCTNVRLSMRMTAAGCLIDANSVAVDRQA